jgi:TPR repeat protein
MMGGLLTPLLARFFPRAALRHALVLGKKGRWDRALPYLARAARAGLSEAQYWLGRCYLEARGVPFDPREGVWWLEKAAEQGFVGAQTALAGLYLHGVKKRIKKSGKLNLIKI